MIDNIDTIAAVATPPGRGGVGVVRVSGPLAGQIAEVITGRPLPPREACFRAFRDADEQLIDRGIGLYFPGPASYTGEDVLELQGHGGPVVMDLLLNSCLAAGARPANPGEFTERAFLNDKLDLAQAEAVADLIESGSAAAARAAVRSLEGEFSRHIDALVDQLIQLRMYIEAALDFSEEEIDFLASDEVRNRLHGLQAAFKALFAQARHGELLRDGMTVVLAGEPNVGKSSLLNRLAGRDSAIVTAIAGTTRDILREHIHIDGLPLHIIDTAGLRDSDDPIEQEGVRRAREALQRADRVLWVHQAGDKASEALEAEIPAGVPVDELINKVDLCDQPARIEARSGTEGQRIYLSAKTGDGVGILREHLKLCAGFEENSSGTFTARRRHLLALESADGHLQRAGEGYFAGQPAEILAEELRLAQRDLEEVTGKFTPEDLLSQIFSSFCIGK